MVMDRGVQSDCVIGGHCKCGVAYARRGLRAHGYLFSLAQLRNAVIRLRDGLDNYRQLGSSSYDSV